MFHRIRCSGVCAAMRVNLKLVFMLMLLAICLTTMSFWTKCTDINKQDNNFYREPGGDTYSVYDDTPQGSMGGGGKRVAMTHINQEQVQTNALQYEEIDCLINDDTTVMGRREGNEVYLPFSFIQQYFEVYGKLTQYDGYERFEWKHSYSKIYRPNGRYTAEGIFMSFEHYNVEVRDRVKCISGKEGVPISTQWGAHGYFYPIQIAQYGLSHYSKQIIEPKSSIFVIDDAEKLDMNRWDSQDENAIVENVMNRQKGSRVIEFKTPDALHYPGVAIKLASTNNFVLQMDIKFISNGSFTVNVESKGGKKYNIHYVCSDTLIMVSGNNIYYGIGRSTLWRHLTRDLAIDLQKGVTLKSKSKKKSKVSIQKAMWLNVRGHGQLDNITMSKTAHMEMFYYAADWLVTHQDKRGGWPIMVTRKLAHGALQLPPGWYSAMAQGQAMPVLTRAYLRTRDAQYLDAALNAVKIFDVPSRDGGVLAMFMDKRPWYEEYPTTPSCYVLNGFIYSLIGLYDLKTVAPKRYTKDADRLYREGIESLKLMLPLFDTGSGTVYDLRHFTLGIAPNLARWDYHSTHVNQLLLLSTINDDPIFAETAKRWIGYMNGKRAAHN